MPNCKDKESNLCVDSLNPKCMEFQGDKGNSTNIDQDCVNQYMVNEDIYSILDKIPKREIVQTYGQMVSDPKTTNKSFLVVNDENRSMTYTRYEYWKEEDILIYIESTLE